MYGNECYKFKGDDEDQAHAEHHGSHRHPKITGPPVGYDEANREAENPRHIQERRIADET